MLCIMLTTSVQSGSVLTPACRKYRLIRHRCYGCRDVAKSLPRSEQRGYACLETDGRNRGAACRKEQFVILRGD